jgi:hypothetical protein
MLRGRNDLSSRVRFKSLGLSSEQFCLNEGLDLPPYAERLEPLLEDLFEHAQCRQPNLRRAL